MRCLPAIAALASCYQHATYTRDGDTDVAVAMTDGAKPGTDGSALCLGAGSLYTYCFASVPSETIDLASTLFTDSDPLCMHPIQSDGTQVCAIAAYDVMAESVRAIGSQPLVIVAWHDVTIGSLDVSSTSKTVGAGGDGPDCITGVGMTVIGGAAGGAGGSYGQRGGQGGDGSSDTGSPAFSGFAPSNVHGGCAGNVGNTTSSPGAPGGHGGGALHVIAGHMISVQGDLDASGGGGGHASGAAGAGGGGSGGLISLVAPTITGATQYEVFANGGGGGGAACLSSMTMASDGHESIHGAAAYGGVGADSASAIGGTGGYQQVAATKGGGPNAPAGTACGGGGGGGGVGWIYLVPSQSPSLSFSPPPH